MRVRGAEAYPVLAPVNPPWDPAVISLTHPVFGSPSAFHQMSVASMEDHCLDRVFSL